MPLPPPKNGRHYVCLIAGAPPDRARELRTMLAQRRGILVGHHWDYQRPLDFDKPVPADVDFVIGIKTQLGHALSDKARRAARVAGVPIMFTDHKWTRLSIALIGRWGLHKTTPLPLNVSSVAWLNKPAPEPEPMVEPVPPAPPPKTELPSNVLHLHPLIERAEAAVREARQQGQPMAATAETLIFIMAVHARLAAEGIDSVLIGRSEITISAAK